MHFDWDPKKAAKNLALNRPTFEEAKEVFAPGAVYLERPVVKNGEERWFRIGQIVRGVAVVVWTVREGNTIRIMSVRFASRKERAAFQMFVNLKE